MQMRWESFGANLIHRRHLIDEAYFSGRVRIVRATEAGGMNLNSAIR